MDIDTFIERTEDFKLLSQKEKVKRLAYFCQLTSEKNNFSSKDIESLFEMARLDAPSNIPDVLGKLLLDKPRDVIRPNGKYGLERHFIKKMDLIYINQRSAKVVGELAGLLDKLKNEKQKEFLADALKCINLQLYRPAIIMAWLLTMDVLYEYVLNNCLVQFNAELNRKNSKCRIFEKSDFEDIKESVFIDTLRSTSIISKEQNKTLGEKLNVRNSAAHPNQTSFKEAKVVSFVEELIADIIEKFQ